MFAGMVAEAEESSMSGSSASASASASDSDVEMLNEMMGNMNVVEEVKEEKKKKTPSSSSEKEKKAAEKALEKEKKEQEKAAKEKEKALEKEKKAAEKTLKEKPKNKKSGSAAVPASPPAAAPRSGEQEKVKLTVTKFVHEGKEYFKTADGVLYDPKTKEEVGVYCELTKSIKALPDDSDSELEEENYSDDE